MDWSINKQKFWSHLFLSASLWMEESFMRVREDTAMLWIHENLFGGVSFADHWDGWNVWLVMKKLILIMKWLGSLFRVMQHKLSKWLGCQLLHYTAEGLWHFEHAALLMQLGRNDLYGSELLNINVDLSEKYSNSASIMMTYHTRYTLLLRPLPKEYY